MSTKIRLQRHGKKSKPFYHIIVADVHSPRDGRFIKKIGIYNPFYNPPIIQLHLDDALYWLEKGAQPTNTVKSILTKMGVYYKKHLLGGVNKGLFDKEEMKKKLIKNQYLRNRHICL
jgi:small subunit ribosomal protein S16